MILYNETILVGQVVEIQLIDWLRKKYIQEVLDTGCFSSARLCRLTSHNEPDSTNYTIQYMAESQEHLKEYKSKYAARIYSECYKLFGEKILIFRTELEVVENFYANQS
ncbi:MAG: DUF4286 family protein [Flavobacteriaceae bacterium]|nr:DUF4286 family protein [Flavobacteriaceae bacterium]